MEHFRARIAFTSKSKNTLLDVDDRAAKLLTSSTFLQPHPLENLLELGVFAHVGQLHVHTCTQAGAQVRWAGEDIAQVLIPHESVSSVLEQALNLKNSLIFMHHTS